MARVRAANWVNEPNVQRRAGPSGAPVATTTTSSSTSSSTSSTTSSSPTSSPSSTSSPTSSPTGNPAASSSIASVASVSSESVASVASVAALSSSQSISSSSTGLVGSSTHSIASQTSSSTVSTTVLVSTVFVTNGVTITSNVAVPTTSSGSGGASSGSHGGGSSHTGAIVGGVVGGIAALAIIALIAFLLWRRRKRSSFDGNWDPDRTIQRPAHLGGNNHLDLAGGGATLPNVVLDEDDGVDTSPRPFSMEGSSPPGSYAPTTATSNWSGNPLLAAGAGAAGGAALAHHHDGSSSGHPQMSQYGGRAPSVMSASTMPSVYPPTSHSGTGLAGAAGAGAGAGALRMTKQQEAARAHAEQNPQYYTTSAGRPRSGSVATGAGADDVVSEPGSGGPASANSGGAVPRLSVMNPDADSRTGSGADVMRQTSAGSRMTGVVQHRDGGRYVPPAPEPENAAEIPPSYDMIPDEERR